MPIPYEPPPTPDGPAPTPPPPYAPPHGTGPIPPKGKQHWVPDAQDYAVRTLVQDRDDALWTFGEYVMIVLLWNIRDFEAGLVARCPTCYTSRGKIADAYGQSGREKCPDCLGTTFQGGFRAKVIRPALFEAIDIDDNPEAARGTVASSSTAMQTTNDLTLHNRDMVFRGDGSRWRFIRPDSMVAYTGFEVKGPTVGWNIGQVVREDESSVAYIVAPSTDDLIDMLAIEGFRRPLDFSGSETIRGPL